MPDAAYDPATPVRVHIVSQSPHTFAYKLWLALPAATAWSELDRGDIETPPRDYGPFPPGTKLAYTLLVAGNPDTDWKTLTILSQGGEPLACSPPAETGITNESGVARRDTAVTLQ
jgi:hypothetical protein